MSFNESLYNTTVKALTENGVPLDVAQNASQVVASDDPNKENLGRTAEQQETVNNAMSWFWGNQSQ